MPQHSVGRILTPAEAQPHALVTTNRVCLLLCSFAPLCGIVSSQRSRSAVHNFVAHRSRPLVESRRHCLSLETVRRLRTSFSDAPVPIRAVTVCSFSSRVHVLLIVARLCQNEASRANFAKLAHFFECRADRLGVARYAHATATNGRGIVPDTPRARRSITR
jgi:hypothetical protein